MSREGQPHTIHVGGPAATADLPKRVVERLATLRERVDDLHRVLPLSEERVAASTAKVEAEQRLKCLLGHPHQGGFGLDEASDKRVIQQKKLVEELSNASQRLTDRYQRPHQSWNRAAQALRSVENWLQSRPGGTRLEDYSGPEPKLLKGESLIDAIDRHRKRAREIQSDLAAVEGAPFPSSHAKAKARRQVEELAQRGAPSVALLLKKDRDVVFPVTGLQANVFNVQAAFAATEVVDTLALTAWLHKDALISALEREIDRQSDDKSALTHAARAQQAAELGEALLSIERQESALVWTGLEQCLPVEHRADCSPMAVLQCRLVTLPA